MPDTSESLPPIHHVGVVGLGLLGRGIFSCLLGYGYRVTGLDVSPQAQAQLQQEIPRDLQEMVSHLAIPDQSVRQWREAYSAAQDPSDLAACDLIIESIPEDLQAKRELYRQLEAACSPRAVIASNTSAIPISILQGQRRHPERFVGLHWLQPAFANPFLEIIRGEATADWAMTAAQRFGESVGKQPVLVQRDVRGFVANRLGYAMLREAFFLLESGVADVEMIDRAIRNSIGMWVGLMGPFRSMDLAGMTAFVAVMKDLLPELSNSTEVPRTLQALVEQGKTGGPAGEGFYQYEPGEAERWQDLIRQFMWESRELVVRYAARAEGDKGNG